MSESPPAPAGPSPEELEQAVADIDTLSRAAHRPAGRDDYTPNVEAAAAYERLHGRLY